MKAKLVIFGIEVAIGIAPIRQNHTTGRPLQINEKMAL